MLHQLYFIDDVMTRIEVHDDDVIDEFEIVVRGFGDTYRKYLGTYATLKVYFTREALC